MATPSSHIDEARLYAAVIPQLVGFMSSLTRRVATQGRVDAPVDTGNLARAIQEDSISITGWDIESGVSAPVHYARFVHEGTGPHIIEPRNARALRFPGPDGRMIFRRRVHHPGTRARPFLVSAATTVVAADPRIH